MRELKLTPGDNARMRLSQTEKGERFRALHARSGAFVIPNPWDAGTARILAGLGFEALTTTSAGLAFTLGKRDGTGEVTRDETMANAKAIADATDLPVAADLENGFGDALPFPFVFVARAENYLHGRPDLDDTIRRLQAFEAAGADALYAPGLTRPEDIRTVCASVGKPVNVLMGIVGATNVALSVADLEALGVRRISVGSALSRAALGAFISAAQEIREHGTFTFARDALPYAEANLRMAAQQSTAG